jgi:hypothetical protein
VGERNGAGQIFLLAIRFPTAVSISVPFYPLYHAGFVQWAHLRTKYQGTQSHSTVRMFSYGKIKGEGKVVLVLN